MTDKTSGDHYWFLVFMMLLGIAMTSLYFIVKKVSNKDDFQQNFKKDKDGDTLHYRTRFDNLMTGILFIGVFLASSALSIILWVSNSSCGFEEYSGSNIEKHIVYKVILGVICLINVVLLFMANACIASNKSSKVTNYFFGAIGLSLSAVAFLTVPVIKSLFDKVGSKNKSQEATLSAGTEKKEERDEARAAKKVAAAGASPTKKRKKEGE